MAKSRTKAALNSGAATNNGQMIAQKRGSYFVYSIDCYIYLLKTIICSYLSIKRITKLNGKEFIP